MDHRARLLLVLMLAGTGAAPALAQTHRLSINGGNTSTFSRSVKLSLAADDKAGVVGYLVSESAVTPLVDSSGWVPVGFTASFQGDVPFTLSPGDGKKTVYAWFRDSAGTVSDPVTAAILLASHVMDNVHEIAGTPDGKELWARSIDTHSIAIADLCSPDYPVIADIQLPGNRSVPLSRMAFSPDGRHAYVSNAIQVEYEEHPEAVNRNQILVIDTKTKVITGSLDLPLTLGPTGSLAAGLDGRFLFATLADWPSSQMGIGKFDIQARKLLGFVRLEGANFVRASPDGQYIYVTQGWGIFGPVPNSVSVVNVDTLQVVSTVPVGTGPGYLAFTPDYKRAYVTNEGSNDVSVVDLMALRRLATIPVGSGPRGVAITADGKKAYVANSGIGEAQGVLIESAGPTVSVIDTETDAVVKAIGVYAEPDAVAMDPDGTKV